MTVNTKTMFVSFIACMISLFFYETTKAGEVEKEIKEPVNIELRTVEKPGVYNDSSNTWKINNDKPSDEKESAQWFEGGDEIRHRGVLEKDDRVIIHKPNKNSLSQNYPVGLIVTDNYNGGVMACSATLIAKNIVITAAHCFHDDINNEIYARKTLFFPQTSKDYSPYSAITASKVILPKAFFKNRAKEHKMVTRSQIENDFAVVYLNENIGVKLGWLGVKYDESIKDVKVEIFSYPKDKKGYLAYEDCSLHENNLSDKSFDVGCDIIQGSSGASLIEKNKRVVWGIVSAESKYINSAVRFNNKTFSILKSWLANKPNKKDSIVYSFSQDNDYTLKFKNHCKSNISLAYKVNTKDGIVTDGLYTVKPGKTLVLNNVTDKKYYFYAKDKRGGEWRGKHKIYLDDYNKRYPFIKTSLKMKYMTGTYTQGLSCN